MDVPQGGTQMKRLVTISTVTAIVLLLTFMDRALAETIWVQLPADNLGENIPSYLDWRLVIGCFCAAPTPGQVVADDFQADGRSVTSIRWWGSYFDPTEQPTMDPLTGLFIPVIEEAYVISFFGDINSGILPTWNNTDISKCK